ncbi:MAG: alpha/beta fold hydrolase [Myxococcales bacterium]|nr:alpha/beta fold hydrolase [Myxococcales bacterium]
MADGEPLRRALLRVRTADHWVLEVERVRPPGPARGVAVVGHAMMVDRRTLDRPRGAGLVSTLARAGWEVFAADLRGRGGASPRASEGAAWSYDDLVRHDLPALVDAARRAAPGLPLFVVGHSLTGHVSVAAAGCGLYSVAPDGHVLLAANHWLPSLEPRRARRALKAAMIAALSLAARSTGRMPARALRIGTVDESADYARQLVRFWRDDRWRSRDGACDYLAALQRVPGSILAVYSRGDRLLGHPEPAVRWARHLPEDAEVWICGRGAHGLTFDPDHMQLVTDPRSTPLWRAVATWMSTRAQAR